MGAVSDVPSVADLLGALVRCPSVNPGPGGACGGFYGEANLVARLAKILEPWADEIVVDEVVRGRPNLIARFGGINPARSFAFEAHSDTVGVDGMTVDPFGARVQEGKLYGRGACDTKGPMTAMLLAILRHLAVRGRPPVAWYFISTCDEELGGMGARKLMASGFRCDGMVVGEPTALVPVDRHKGALRFQINVCGRAAHSAYPEQGANAIHAAASLIRDLEGMVAGLCRDEFTPEPGQPTFSTGTIQGGDQVNRIPDAASFEIDLRLPPGCPSGKIAETLEAARTKVTRERPGICVEWIETQNYPSFVLPADRPFRDLLAPIRGSGGGGFGAVRYATNAGFFPGIDCVVFGPGSVAQAHTADEWIELAEIETAADRLLAFITQAR